MTDTVVFARWPIRFRVYFARLIFAFRYQSGQGLYTVAYRREGAMFDNSELWTKKQVITHQYCYLTEDLIEKLRSMLEWKRWTWKVEKVWDCHKQMEIEHLIKLFIFERIYILKLAPYNCDYIWLIRTYSNWAACIACHMSMLINTYFCVLNFPNTLS